MVVGVADNARDRAGGKVVVKADSKEIYSTQYLSPGEQVNMNLPVASVFRLTVSVEDPGRGPLDITLGNAHLS
jgi:hypothetical protein